MLLAQELCGSVISVVFQDFGVASTVAVAETLREHCESCEELGGLERWRSVSVVLCEVFTLSWRETLRGSLTERVLEGFLWEGLLL